MKFNKTVIAYLVLILTVVSVFVSMDDTKVNAAENQTVVTSNLEVWDNTPVFVNETAYLYANYSYENDTIATAECIVSFNDEIMTENTTYYYYEHIFENSGNYSYSVSCNKQGYENKTTSSEIEVLPIETGNNSAVDYDNDGYAEGVDCNDNNSDVNPGEEEKLYNGIDDDCNPATLDYLIFDVATNKQTYFPKSTVKIDINATNYSDTYITINTPSNVSYVYVFTNDTYPVRQEFSLTETSGLYSIEAANYYKNYTNEKTVEFNVEDTFSVDIQVDDDSVYTDENIHFKAKINGAVGNTNLIWNMDDGTEKYDQEFDYNYDSPGKYNVVLIATDEGGNQEIISRKITVLKQYYLKVKVKDNKTGNLLNATVELDSEDKQTNSSGMVEYKVTNRSYDLDVSADDYYDYSADLKINKSLVFTVKLNQKLTSQTPLITLISPNNGSEVKDPKFKYKFTDNTKATCTLYTSEGDGWWVEQNKSKNLKSNTEYTFSLDLEPKVYLWRVLCVDEDDNVAYSNENEIEVIDQVVTTQSETPDRTYNVVQNVYDVLPDTTTYSPDEKKVAAYLDLEATLKEARRKLNMANRDLYNIRFEEDTESVIDKRDEIYEDIDEVKDKTPQSIRVNDKANFVKYVDEKNIEELFNQYVDIKKTELSNRELKNLIEQNKLLQKKATIQTTAYNVRVTYISGRIEDLTIVVRNIEFSGQNLNTVRYVEFIPKEVIETTDDIQFISEPDNILKKDPVFEYRPSETMEVVYYVKEEINTDTIPKIQPLFITTVLDEQSMSGVTGFAIFDELGFSESNTKLFVVELLIVFILLGVYLFFHFRNDVQVSIPKLSKNVRSQPKVEQKSIKRNISQVDEHHKLQYMRTVIRQTEEHIKEDNLEDAALKYYEIKFLYDLLSENDKKAVFNEIIQVSNEIHLNHINALIDESIILLASGKKQEAQEIYTEITLEFDKLTENYKDKVYSKCCELALHLQNEA